MRSGQNIFKKGFIVAYVLVFASVFLMIFSGVLGYILLQLRQSEQRLAWNLALDIAEAGINHYQWCLNNGVESGCLGEKITTTARENCGGPIRLRRMRQRFAARLRATG